MTDKGHVEAVQEAEIATASVPAEAEQGEQLVEDTLINLYDVLIAVARADIHPDRPGPRTNWSPSAFGKCDRAMILEHAGVKKNPVTDATALFFWIGHVIHDAVQKAVSARLPGQSWHELVVKSEKYHVSGKLDTLRMVRAKDGGTEVVFDVFEYKSVRTAAFNFPLPQAAHVLQVALYLTFPVACPMKVHFAQGGLLATAEHANECDACSGSGMLPLPRIGRIAYIGKEDGKIETYTVRQSPELQAEVKKKLRSLDFQFNVFMKTGVMPDKLAKKQIKVKGELQFYKKSGKWGKAGDPKMEDDYRTFNCDYKGSGKCCADKESP